MTIEQLEAFLQVCRRGSFAAAARALDVQPSAISRRVAALEASLGVKLLQRTTRSVSLTEAGRDLEERAGPALQALYDAADDLRRADAALAGRVRVSMPGALGRQRIAPLLFAFAARHPGITLDLWVSDAKLDLVAERIDLAIRVGRPRQPGFAVRTLGRSPQVFAASPAWIARHGRPTSIPALGDLPRVIWRAGAEVIDVPDAARPPALICDDMETHARATEAGLGVALLPSWRVEGRAGLEALDIPAPIQPVPIVAILPAGRRPPRRVRVLLDHLAAGLGG